MSIFSFARLSAFALVLLTASGAMAAPVSVDLGFASYTLGGTEQPGNVDLQSLPANTGWPYHNYTVDQGSLKLRRADIVTNIGLIGPLQTTKPTGLAEDEHYLAVYGIGRRPGHAAFALDQPADKLSFLWGSVDSHNWLSVENAEGKTYTITGSDILASVAGLASLPGTTRSTFFSLTDLAGIIKVVFFSRGNAFEIAKLSVSNVPLPAALPLFAAGLLGLAGARKLRKKEA